MATYSSSLAWRIPLTEEAGGLQFMGSQRWTQLNDQEPKVHLRNNQARPLGTKIMLPLLSVQFSHSVVSDSLWPHGLQHASLPCPSPNPRVYSNSCPLSQWCHPTISSSVIPFSGLLSFPASGSFLMSQLFTSGSQSIGASASASVLPMNIYILMITTDVCASLRCSIGIHC